MWTSGALPMHRHALLVVVVLLSLFVRTSVGGLPASCVTPKKQLQALAKRFFDPTKAGEVFCPLRENPIEHLEESFAHIAGQESARVCPHRSLPVPACACTVRAGSPRPQLLTAIGLCADVRRKPYAPH